MVLRSLQNCSKYWTFTLFLPPEMWGCCQKRNRAGFLSPRIASSSGKMEAVTALFFHHIPPKTSPCKSNTWANFLATDWRADSTTVYRAASACEQLALLEQSWGLLPAAYNENVPQNSKKKKSHFTHWKKIQKHLAWMYSIHKPVLGMCLKRQALSWKMTLG